MFTFICEGPTCGICDELSDECQGHGRLNGAIDIGLLKARCAVTPLPYREVHAEIHMTAADIALLLENDPEAWCVFNCENVTAISDEAAVAVAKMFCEPGGWSFAMNSLATGGEFSITDLISDCQMVAYSAGQADSDGMNALFALAYWAWVKIDKLANDGHASCSDCEATPCYVISFEMELELHDKCPCGALVVVKPA
jgi:hypothetical protein